MLILQSFFKILKVFFSPSYGLVGRLLLEGVDGNDEKMGSSWNDSY